MHLKIILLLVFGVIFPMTHVDALKRIKRQFNLMAHDKRMKQDFIVLPSERQEHSEAAKETQNSALYNAGSDNVTESNKKCNRSRPLVEVLQASGLDLTENRKQELNGAEVQQTADLKARASNIKGTKAATSPLKYCNANEMTEQHSKYHKYKHSPHSTRVLEAKFVMPSQRIRPALPGGLGTYGSTNLNNMIMYKFGMDSSPSAGFYPKMILAQNSPSFFADETINEPYMGYFFNSFVAPKQHNLYRQAFKQSNNPVVDNAWQTQAIFHESPAASVNEPTPLASLMQNALDTLLAANRADIEGDKSEQQIELSCPIHPAKENAAQVEGDKADVIQVCSCRLIKKAKDDDVKKFI